jgi:hypothetical protein
MVPDSIFSNYPPFIRVTTSNPSKISLYLLKITAQIPNYPLSAVSFNFDV